MLKRHLTLIIKVDNPLRIVRAIASRPGMRSSRNFNILPRDHRRLQPPAIAVADFFV
jgi:hypothetical protein